MKGPPPKWRQGKQKGINNNFKKNKTMKTVFYTINGSELKDIEIEETNQNIKQVILDHENSMLNNEGGDEEGSVYTIDMIELSE